MNADEFSNALLKWYDVNHRDLPWRGKSDLYEVWISEVMLQQTQVDYVQKYYQRFLDAFPTFEALAAADLDDILRLWEGMGYYARARNLYASARKIVGCDNLPTTSQDLQSFPGLGPYSSRAIASIVCGEPVAAVDGNVRRVISRIFAHLGDSAKEIQNYADSLLCHHRPGDYNQAIMELGSQVCTPKRPQCPNCPVQTHCTAYSMGTPQAFPVSKIKGKIPHYDVAVGVLRNQSGQIFIQQRPSKGLLGGLWELPGGKATQGESGPDTCQRELYEELGVKVSIGTLVGQVNHAYSHFRITLRAYECTIVNGCPVSSDGLKTKWVDPLDLKNYAFPRANRRILELLTPL
ncbi:MAG: A/G-specific adenine glycosylase [Bacteroidetes bacterium]|nr:A/G-specific adenine glycosylase [Bacteroidota bacterium]